MHRLDEERLPVRLDSRDDGLPLLLLLVGENRRFAAILGIRRYRPSDGLVGLVGSLVVLVLPALVELVDRLRESAL